MAAAVLFWNTNMAAMTSREIALLSCRSCHGRAIGWPVSHFATTMLCWDTFVEGPGVCHSIYKVVDSGSEIFATFEELKKSLFTSHYLTHWPYCPRRLKKLCFSTPSLAAMKMRARLGVLKQSFFSLRGQYGRRVIKVNAVRGCEILREISMSECSFGISSHWGACCSSCYCDLKHLLRPWIFLQAFLKRTCAGFYGV